MEQVMPTKQIDISARAKNIITTEKTLTKAAKAVGISRRTLSRIASGETKNPSQATRAKINRLYLRRNDPTTKEGAENRRLEKKYGVAGVRRTNRRQAELLVRYHRKEGRPYKVFIEQEMEIEDNQGRRQTWTVYAAHNDDIEAAQKNLDAKVEKIIQSNSGQAGNAAPLGEPSYRVWDLVSAKEAQFP